MRNFPYQLFNLRPSSTAKGTLLLCALPLRGIFGSNFGCWDQKLDHFPLSVFPSSRSFFVRFLVHLPFAPLRVPRSKIAPPAWSKNPQAPQEQASGPDALGYDLVLRTRDSLMVEDEQAINREVRLAIFFYSLIEYRNHWNKKCDEGSVQ
eukprot:scaffold77234_cov27-Attheya_sp.AAC.1